MTGGGGGGVEGGLGGLLPGCANAPVETDSVIFFSGTGNDGMEGDGREEEGEMGGRERWREGEREGGREVMCRSVGSFNYSLLFL